MGSDINTGARLPCGDGICRRGFVCLCAGQPVVDLLYLWIDPRIGRGGGE